MDDDGNPLCPACGVALVAAHIAHRNGRDVVYEHSDYIARRFTKPCVVRKASHAEALAALNELPEEWE